MRDILKEIIKKLIDSKEYDFEVLGHAESFYDIEVNENLFKIYIEIQKQ